jgi:uncharacterized protein YqeY
MSLKQQIDSDLKHALLAGDKPKVTALRGLKAVILDAEVATGAREAGLDDATIESLIQKEVKKRRESADIYRANGREELAEIEEAEAEQFTGYLPKQLDESELTEIITGVIAETGAESAKDMGKVIGAVRGKVGNSADGALIARIVKQKLGG